VRVDTLISMRFLLGLAMATGCDGPATEQAPPVTKQAEPAAAPVPAKAAPAAKKVETLAQVTEDVPLPLPKLLGHAPAEVEALLGAAQGKGMDRGSCVRFVPERVFFACEYKLRPHADKTGTFEEVIVGYEDGVATELTFDGLKAGSGPFAPQALLEAIGLSLPEPGKLTKPTGSVRLWSWFNSIARLRIADKEYRVEVSVVEEDWSRGRISVLQNDRLTPEQSAKILQPAVAPKASVPASDSKASP